MSNLTVENVYTRHKAKELCKLHFWKLLGMMLIIFVFTYGIMAVGMLLLSLVPGAQTTTELTSTSASFNVDGSGALYTIGYMAMMLVIFLMSSGLGLGMSSALLDLGRGAENVSVGRVFSRMGQCLKALRLSLWIGLKTFLWMLPGYAVMIIALFVTLGAVDANSTASTESVISVLSIIPFAGMILIATLVIPAAFRYMLSTYILADKPETGIRACVSESKAMMKGHKWQAFKLVMPTILILYAIIFGAALVLSLPIVLLSESAAAVAAILSIVLVIGIFFLVLYFSIRVCLTYCLFYLNRCNEVNPAVEAAQEEAPTTEAE